MSKLICNMVTRNEADRFLPEVLAHLATITRHIVVTDDCSSDDTVEVAESYGAYTYSMEKPTFTVNESELRTQAWANLGEHAQPGDWILCIDADELFYGAEFLPTLMDQSQYDVLGVSFVHMWNASHYRVDKAWRPSISSRLFRYFLGGTFMPRRLACGSEPSYVNELIRRQRMLWNTPLTMQHLGYLRDEDKVAKYRRYQELDGGNFHSLAHIESILDPNPTLVPWQVPHG